VCQAKRWRFDTSIGRLLVMLSVFWGEKPRKTQALAVVFGILLLGSRILHLQSWPLTGFALFDRPRTGDQIQAYAFRCTSHTGSDSRPQDGGEWIYPQFFMDPYLVDRVVTSEILRIQSHGKNLPHSPNQNPTSMPQLYRPIGEELMRISGLQGSPKRCELLRRLWRRDLDTRRTRVRDLQLWVSDAGGPL
jgi:hypothetical protein